MCANTTTNWPDGRILALDLCFLDVETTGSLIGHHELLDIAAIRTDPAGESARGTWSRKIRPQHPERISDRARELTGYCLENWESSESSTTELWESFVSFVGGCVPICHKPSFDRAFITLAARDAGISDLRLDYHWIGTESLAWTLYREGQLAKLSLNQLCEHFDIEAEGATHHALHGAEACRQVYLALMKRP